MSKQQIFTQPSSEHRLPAPILAGAQGSLATCSNTAQAIDVGETMSKPSQVTTARKAGGNAKRGQAAMDHAPRVEMGGKSIVIIGGNVSTIPARGDDDQDEIAYEKGQLA